MYLRPNQKITLVLFNCYSKVIFKEYSRKKDAILTIKNLTENTTSSSNKAESEDKEMINNPIIEENSIIAKYEPNPSSNEKETSSNKLSNQP